MCIAGTEPGPELRGLATTACGIKLLTLSPAGSDKRGAVVDLPSVVNLFRMWGVARVRL